MHIHLNPSSGVPIYRQITDEVKVAFLRGSIRPGDRMPSVRELAGNLGINPTTVVKAYDQLENESLIVRRQGQGAFVADGMQLIHPQALSNLMTQAARQMAIEGRRLGLSEIELLAFLQEELAKLRPRSKEKKK